MQWPFESARTHHASPSSGHGSSAIRLRYASGEAAGLSNRREGFDLPTERHYGSRKPQAIARSYFDLDADFRFAFGFAAEAAVSLLLLRLRSWPCARL